MAEILSKGIKLSYKLAETYVQLKDLLEIPELGGTVDKVEVTNLEDGNRRYINGLKDFGDLTFKFNYVSGAAESFMILSDLEAVGEEVDFQVELPDGVTFTFSGTPSVKLDTAGINAALTFSLALSLSSDMVIA